MKLITLILLLLVPQQLVFAKGKIAPPSQGAYIGAYTDSGAGADEVSEQKIIEFEELIGKKLKWSYFSNNWTGGKIIFPHKNMHLCKQLGIIPYVRLLPWVQMRTSGPDPHYKLIDFINGKYDKQLKEWAKEAKAYIYPIMIEFGPEVNGDWFAWNGKWNGRGTKDQYGSPDYPDGPEKFRDAYRRIISLFRSEGVQNVTWVFHVDTAPSPHRWWNRAKYYYPGDNYIDWIGLSVFGAQLPSHKWITFRSKLKRFWPQVEELSMKKPVMISEFAVIEDNKDRQRKARWIEQSLRLLRLDRRFQRIKAITYWNSPGWLKDGSADFRVTSSKSATKSFIKEISNSHWIGRLAKKEDKND